MHPTSSCDMKWTSSPKEGTYNVYSHGESLERWGYSATVNKKLSQVLQMFQLLCDVLSFIVSTEMLSNRFSFLLGKP